MGGLGGDRVGKEDRLKLTTGSRYRITSMMTRDEPLVTEGTFKGYTMVGNIDALLLDTAPPTKAKGEAKGKAKTKGKAKPKEQLRLIPAQMIISIDVLDQAEEKEEEEKTSTSRYYY
jgi:hypothetical protein